MFFSSKEFDIGLVLGGGGTRGFAHLGVYKALEEKGIKPDVISGVSAGAVMGAFLGDGMTADEVFEILHDRDFFSYSKFRLYKLGLVRLEGLKKDLEEHTSVQNLEDLKTPLIVTVSNLNKGIVEYRREGDLVKTVIASSSIPVLFTPMRLGDYQFVDGGLFDNLPYEPIKDSCKKIIAVNISPVEETNDLDGIIDISARVFQLSTRVNSSKLREEVDILIEPENITDFNILDSGKAKEMYDLGYEAAKKADLDSLK